MARRRLVFEQLIAPLVRETPARALHKQEKALLILACVATAGHRRGAAAAAREGHRQDFDALLRETMAAFAVQLGEEYAAIKAQAGGAKLSVDASVDDDGMWKALLPPQQAGIA